MTTIYLDKNDEIYIIKSLTYNITAKPTKLTRKNLKLGKTLLFLVPQNLQTLHSSKVSPRTLLPLTLVLKLWLVYMTFFAIILSHLRIHSSKKYSLFSLHVFILIFSIISPVITPWMTNHSFDSSISSFYSDDSTYFS